MAVALTGLSDTDFYVSMHTSLPPVTRAQRVQIAEALERKLAARSIHYDALRLRENRIHGVGGGLAPDFDVVFKRFAGEPPKQQPNRRPLSMPVQLAACFIRLMPEVYTNLVQPQSSALIDWAEAEEVMWGASFNQLLIHLLECLASGSPPPEFFEALRRKQQHMDAQRLERAAVDWGHAARRVLSLIDASGARPQWRRA